MAFACSIVWKLKLNFSFQIIQLVKCLFFRSEFTNYSHEEILNRNDNVSNSSQKDSTLKKDSEKTESVPQNERIIPIKLDSGEEIMPIFTKLEDPEPPAWYSPSQHWDLSLSWFWNILSWRSTFSKKNQQNGKSSPVKEKIVPMKVETDREAQDDRGRKKSKPTIENGTSKFIF